VSIRFLHTAVCVTAVAIKRTANSRDFALRTRRNLDKAFPVASLQLAYEEGQSSAAEGGVSLVISNTETDTVYTRF